MPGYQKRLTLYVLNVEVKGSYLEAIDRRDSSLQGYQMQLTLYVLDVVFVMESNTYTLMEVSPMSVQEKSKGHGTHLQYKQVNIKFYKSKAFK